MIIGGTRTERSQGAYAFDMEGLDSVQFGNAPSPADPTGLAVVPPFDQIASAAYGAQLIETYWASLLRDVAFTDYATNATAIAAAAELTTLPDYRGQETALGTSLPICCSAAISPGKRLVRTCRSS